jgi:hypothetical protein
MRSRRGVLCLVALIGFSSLGAAGCGGGVPTTGDTVNVQKGDVERRNAMVEGYKNNMAPPKAAAKAKR